ncbi:MAG: HD domain-containing protein [Sedimenticolaceae bacterium]
MNTSKLVLKAVHFAALKHRDQRRKDAESSPYIIHPISVALTVSDIGGIDDPEILAAALLHDTLEDTNTTVAELEETFGAAVRKYVEEVTDDKSLPKQERKQIQIEHAATLSTGAALIKLGDKISNVTDVTHSPPSNWDVERRKQYLDWAEAVINSCPKVNESLEKHFVKVVEHGRQVLLKA